MLDIKITKTETPKEKPQGPLGFGKIFTDHMFVMDYTEGKGWHDARGLRILKQYSQTFLSHPRQWFSITDRRCLRDLRPIEAQTEKVISSVLI